MPYGVYKMGTGWYLWAIQGHMVGWLLLAWGIVDFSTNLLVLFWRRPIPYCLLAALGYHLDRLRYLQRRRHLGEREDDEDERPEPHAVRPFRWEELGLGVDALLSFLFVSAMIWFGAIPQITPAFGRAWDIAVVANVTAVGLGRVLEALRHPLRH